MKHVLGAVCGASCLLLAVPVMAETTLTIATVNNGDMIRMQGLTERIHQEEPGHHRSNG